MQEMCTFWGQDLSQSHNSPPWWFSTALKKALKVKQLSIENTSLKANVDYYKPYYNESIQLEEQIEE